MPADTDHLAAFLDEYADAPGFELVYTDDEAEEGTRTRVLRDAELLTKTLHRAVPPTVRCDPVAVDEPSFGVTVDDIERLSTTQPDIESRWGDAETPAERAAGLRRFAGDYPMKVDVSQVLTFLDCIDPTPKRDALDALRSVVDVRPRDCTPALPILRSLLERDAFLHTTVALEVLAELAAHDAADVAPLADVVTPYLSATETETRRAATRCVSELAAHDSTDVVDSVPALATVLHDVNEGRQYAAYALCRVAADHPAEVRPVVPALREVIVDESASTNERLSATAALGRVTGEYPDAALPVVDDLAELLEVEHTKLRNNAIGVLGDVAKLHQDQIAPYASELARFVDAGDAFTRVNTTAALSRLAETHPEAIEPSTERFVERLTDDNAFVRENVCWALGYLRAEAARDDLASVATDDANTDVRTRAQWALDRLQ
jgi:hypothetical protein